LIVLCLCPFCFVLHLAHTSFSIFANSISFQGADYVDLASAQSLEYNLAFLGHKEGNSTIEATFTNKQTNEYMQFEISVRFIAAGVLDTITLRTCVRQAVSYTFLLENPLSNAITFNATCNYVDGGKGTCTEVQLPPNAKVPGKSEKYEFTVEFFPLRARNTVARIQFATMSHELGAIAYDLNLVAVAAPQQLREFLWIACGLHHYYRLRGVLCPAIHFCTHCVTQGGLRVLY
jgi:hypothetical protein